MIARLRFGAALRGAAALALMPTAVVAVHQLRYWLAFGSWAPVELQRQGHSYLHSLAPWIVLLIAVAAGSSLCAVGRALGGDRSLTRYSLSFIALWILCAGCLLAIFVTQELLEGLFATGHPSGLAGVFGFGGWWAVPAALAVGLVLAAVFQGARWALREVARRHVPQPRMARPLRSPKAPRAVIVAGLGPLAGGWSQRGP